MIDPAIINTLIFSGIASMSSVGLTLTYLTTRVPNFAHGSFLTVGAYVAVYWAQILRRSPYEVLILSALLGGLLAVAQYKIILNPLRKRGASSTYLMIATLTVAFFIFGVMSILADYFGRVYRVRTNYISLRSFDFVIASVPFVMFLAIASVVTSTILLYIFLNKTRLGVAMRASIENPDLAQVLGIDIERMYLLAWFISGSLGGLSGLMYAMWLPVTTTSGDEFLPTIFASSILGGLSSIFGSLAGGVLVGAANSVIPQIIAAMGFTEIIQYRPVIPLLIMSVVLLTIPRGLTSLTFRTVRPSK
ncbi:MAG: branched-chain amino acid ABC transporter permease [Nitrososphaerota archaeon]|nr:branched-chain amino acid ABC transporter permease [Candidatus Calditenuaceae archaeon]MDW8073209.1 branched-chain amino acid ABC transporter permease [Nitrososphaerota archaeon]